MHDPLTVMVCMCVLRYLQSEEGNGLFNSRSTANGIYGDLLLEDLSDFDFAQSGRPIIYDHLMAFT